MTEKAEREIIIKNRFGVHARPASMIVQLANKFRSDVFICKDSVEINGKSIMGVLTLAANCGAKIKIRAVGPDAEDAVEQISQLFNTKFGEEQ